MEVGLRELVRCFGVMFEWSRGLGEWLMSLVDVSREILSAARLGVR